MKLNRVQLVAAKAYDGAQEMLMLDDLSSTFPTKALTQCGDTLFRFVMYELEDVADHPDQALSRITVARLQLEEIERVIFSSNSGLWTT